MSFRKTLIVAAVAVTFAAGFAVRGTVGSITPVLSAQASGRVYELRTYTAAPGKMDALHARFRNHTLRIFAKHGVSNIAYLVPTEGPMAGNTLIYTIVHANRAAADKFWNDFQTDPEWVKAKAESEANGPLTTKVERVWLTPTEYSQVK